MSLDHFGSLFYFVSFFSSVYVCFPAALWTALCVLAETLGSTPKGHVLMCFFRALMSAFFSRGFRQALGKMLFFLRLYGQQLYSGSQCISILHLEEVVEEVQHPLLALKYGRECLVGSFILLNLCRVCISQFM